MLFLAVAAGEDREKSEKVEQEGDHRAGIVSRVIIELGLCPVRAERSTTCPRPTFGEGQERHGYASAPAHVSPAREQHEQG
jgi:hypothetical protein